VNGLSDSVAWPARDPQWVSKVLLMGLIGIIPILGQLVLLGWMLSALDNLRAGRSELPAAGFSYIERGASLFVVLLLYGVGLGVVWGALFGVGLALTFTPRLGAIGVVVILFGYSSIVVGVLGFYLLTPPIVVATERGGIGGGLNLPAILKRAGETPTTTFACGLFVLVAYLIGGIGAIACLIGQFFTAPYGYAVLAGVVRHYELNAFQ
jgi:hypothetical protein